MRVNLKKLYAQLLMSLHMGFGVGRLRSVLNFIPAHVMTLLRSSLYTGAPF